MAAARAECAACGWVPLYHYTQTFLAPLIAKTGFRMSTQGQGDGGVYFSLNGPGSYDVGSPSYEDNIIIDCFGKERLEEYRGKHKLDALFVYGAEPSVLQQAPGGRDNAKMVSKRTFEDLSLPSSDGCYYLRPDRILCCFLLDPAKPPLGYAEVQTEMGAEVERDLQAKEFLATATGGSEAAAPRAADGDRLTGEGAEQASAACGADASVEAVLRGSGLEAHASALVALGFAGASASRDKESLSEEKLLNIGMSELEARKFRSHAPVHDASVPSDNARQAGEAPTDDAGRAEELRPPATSQLPRSIDSAGLGAASTGTIL